MWLIELSPDCSAGPSELRCLSCSYLRPNGRGYFLPALGAYSPATIFASQALSLTSLLSNQNG